MEEKLTLAYCAELSKTIPGVTETVCMEYQNQTLINFSNGYMISVIKGEGAYCGEGTVEVGVLDHKGRFNYLPNSGVEGWVDKSRFIEILVEVSNL